MPGTTVRVDDGDQTRRRKQEQRERASKAPPAPPAMVYQYRPGTRLRGVPAQVVGERLEGMRRQYGAITADLVVADAAPPDAPLHPLFEWNDTLAAMQHRRQTARHIIGSVVQVHIVEGEGGDERAISVRAFVVVNEGGGHGNVYTSTVVAMSDAGLRNQVVRRAFAELKAFRTKYGNLQELASVFEALEEAEQEVEI